MSALVDAWISEVGSKYADIHIKDKSTSTMMRVVGKLLGLFNPKFDQYITTVGTTIYVPKGFMDKNPARALEIIVHETRHVKDYKANPVLFVLGYGAPQIFSLLAIPLVITLLVCGLGLWSLLGLLPLVLLAPIPSYGRYKSELVAYRTSLVFGKYVYDFSDIDMDLTRVWIVDQLSEKWYYWAWPFPNQIRKDLSDTSYESEPFYVDMVEFCKKHQVKL